MTKIYYSEALNNQDILVILENDLLFKNKYKTKIKIKDKKDKELLNIINKKEPISFIKANKLIHRLLNEIEYIEFWSNKKIYKIK